MNHATVGHLVPRLIALHIGLLVAARVLVTLLARASGFDAISDDDFARVTIAQAFAENPRLDPSGTSWLPLPFWLNGLVMMVAGPSLTTARAVALAASVFASAGLYLAAVYAKVDKWAAFAGALGATLMPPSVFTGAAMVPELPTAVLSASALLLLRRREPSALVVASCLIFAATLCRYEPWPVALWVAAAVWLPGTTVPSKWRVLASSIALLGPVVWLAWNAYAHGDALHFHSRVSSFWWASGQGTDLGWTDLLRGYPFTFIAGLPELALVGAAATALCVRTSTPLSGWGSTLTGVVLGVAALTVAQAMGGSPTHHPERALTLGWLVVWIVAIDRAVAASRVGLASMRLPPVILGAAVLFSFVYGVQNVAPTYGVDRGDEVRLGEWLKRQPQAGPILLQPNDYGYFAIEAALAEPGRLSLATPVDQRLAPRASPFATREDLGRAVAGLGASWLVVPRGREGFAGDLGQRVYEQGRWRVYRVEARGPSL